jgi:hypothetical protein
LSGQQVVARHACSWQSFTILACARDKACAFPNFKGGCARDLLCIFQGGDIIGRDKVIPFPDEILPVQFIDFVLEHISLRHYARERGQVKRGERIQGLKVEIVDDSGTLQDTIRAPEIFS